MKVIDLLNKIANGEEVPVYINIRGCEYRRASNHSIENYYKTENDVNWLDNQDIKLNDEIEILDEEDEFIDIESFGIHYSWDYIDYKNIEELKKYLNRDFQNIFDTLDKLIKNQKKIINKLNLRDF